MFYYFHKFSISILILKQTMSLILSGQLLITLFLILLYLFFWQQAIHIGWTLHQTTIASETLRFLKEISLTEIPVLASSSSAHAHSFRVGFCCWLFCVVFFCLQQVSCSGKVAFDTYIRFFYSIKTEHVISFCFLWYKAFR